MAGPTIDEQLESLRRRRSTPALHQRAASLHMRWLRLTGRSQALVTRSRQLRLGSVVLGVSIDRAPDNGAPDNGAPANGAPGNVAPNDGARDNQVAVATLSDAHAPPFDDAAPTEGRTPGGIVGFRLRGVIEGEPVFADWTPEAPVASDALMVRAGIVVRLGETFVGTDGWELDASLDEGPTRALLTFMRACDRVESVSVSLGTASDGSRPY
ncbi:MAG TPA: hypothetical protein VFH70_08965 [Acidimicrobiales bacterium]|nr:hypothetical protein [Acidimicrobiales bacterium]